VCLILLAWQADSRYRLVLAANRDELHLRPSLPAHWWADHPGLFGGRDREAGGTWFGIARAGRFAALTNFRDLRRAPRPAESRGRLVSEYLAGNAGAAAHLTTIASQSGRWLPFNLLAGDRDALACLGSEDGQVRMVTPGIHGISNHLLDSPWPKVSRGCAGLAERLDSTRDAGLTEALFGLLADRSTAPDAELPDTGLPLARERAVSAAMIVDPVYGTRCATVLLIEHDGRWTCSERSFDAAGRATGQVDASGDEGCGTSATAVAGAMQAQPAPGESSGEVQHRVNS
jgi:uncharacterized protein with NRDE domain